MNVRSSIAASLGLAALTLFSGPAYAHKVIAAVFVNGSVIEGEVGFSNGDMAEGARVRVFGEDDVELGEAITDADGFFSFTPATRTTHIFKVNLGAGHVAEVRLEASELPEQGTPTADKSADHETQASLPRSRTGGAEERPAPFNEDYAALQRSRELIRQIVHQEMQPLRREIATYKEKNDFQSILGGIGYIAGIFGVAFYIAASRKRIQG